MVISCLFKDKLTFLCEKKQQHSFLVSDINTYTHTHRQTWKLEKQHITFLNPTDYHLLADPSPEFIFEAKIKPWRPALQADDVNTLLKV